MFERGDGPWLHDIDGNKYLDYIGSWGPMILGHQCPAISAAVHAAVDRGTSFGAPTVAENELAQLIIDSLPSVEMVRLVNSGSEATMSAIRVARGYTGRDIVIKFAGNYHGQWIACWFRRAVRRRPWVFPIRRALRSARLKIRWC